MTGKVIPLSDQFPERKPDRVTTYDLLSTSTIGYRSNPDTLVGRHGLTIYSKMANDEQVKAVLNFKRDAITARGWQFVFRDGTKLSDADQEQRRRLFTEVVARMRGSFADALNAIMTGRAYGFSIVEKVYGEIEVDGRTWPAINMLLGRDPVSFLFYTDRYGVLEKIEQQTHHSGIVAVDRKAVIHYVHAPEWDHVYGRSDLREAYRSWYIKDQISNLWPRYLERFAGGFLHAAQSAEASLSTAELDTLDDALRRANSLGAIRTPPGITLTVIHPPAAADAYEQALQFHDLAIAKALLVPNLLGISQAGGGSYAQSQTQLEAFFWTLNADAVRLEECLNEQLFRDLGDQSWGDGEYPEFRFKPASVEHQKWVVQTFLQMVTAGAALPTEADEAFLRRMLDLPAREEDAKTLAEVQQERAPAPPPPAPPVAEEGEEPEEADEEGEEEKPTPVGKGELREFAREVVNALRPPPSGKRPHRAFITFESDAERDAWLSSLKPRDEIELGARLAFDETDDDAAPSSPCAELSVALHEDVVELPLRARLTVCRVAGQRVEVRYRGD